MFLVQELTQAILSSTAFLLQVQIEGVQQRVERGVERQHEDGHGHVDLARDGDALGGKQPQQANREPAQKVRHHHTQQATGHGQVCALAGVMIGVNSKHQVSFHTLSLCLSAYNYICLLILQVQITS